MTLSFASSMTEKVHSQSTHPFAGRKRRPDWHGWGCRRRRSATDARASANRASASMETANRRRPAGRRGCRRRRRSPIGRWPGQRCSAPTRQPPASNDADVAVVGEGVAMSTERRHHQRRCPLGSGPLSMTTLDPVWKQIILVVRHRKRRW